MRRSVSLIFDLDGTLIDSSAGVVEAVNYSLQQLGLPTRSHDEISRHIGFPLRKMYADFGVGPFDELYRHFQDRAATSVIHAAAPLPSAHRVVEHLSAEGYSMAIATTKVRRHLDQIVAKLAWTAFFPVLVGGDEVAQPKPSPDAFLLAMERLNSVPSNSLVIGDTINDVLAGRSLGIPVVAVLSPYGGNDELRASSPDYVIDSISALPDLLGELNSRKEAI